MAESKHFLLRLDPGLFEAVRRWADDDLRSINAQIEYLLTDQARRAGRLPHRRTRPKFPDSNATDEEEEPTPAGEGRGSSAPGGRRRAARR
jgi:hypothetical protein